MNISPAHKLASLPPEIQAKMLAEVPPDDLASLAYAWPFWARPDQLPPPGDWRTWLLLAGRGFGKTRTGAEWVRSQAESGKRAQIGIIGPTASSVRGVQVEGPSGVLAVSSPDFRPSYEPSTRRIIWPNGCMAYLFSAEEPDRLRGPNLDSAWVDEAAAYANLDAVWDMLQMALRLPGPKGDAPQVVISTTPKPLPLLKAIIAAPSTVITRGRTMDNAANLDASTLKYLQDRYDGTSMGRQELLGEMLADAEGALWRRGMIEENRILRAPAELRRIVVAVDPAGSSNKNSDETGIIVAGIDDAKTCYILQDLSGKYSPEGWARRAVDAFILHKADRIVCEKNFGGDMAENTIRTVARHVPVKMVHASRGKVIRAEPVVALYEQRRVRHAGVFPELESQMCEWEPNSGMPSPDRLDALVWAISELALLKHGAGGSFNLSRFLTTGTLVPN